MRTIRLNAANRAEILDNYITHLEKDRPAEVKSLSQVLFERVGSLYVQRTLELKERLEGTEVFSLLRKTTYWSHDLPSFRTKGGVYVPAGCFTVPSDALDFRPVEGLDELIAQFSADVDSYLSEEYRSKIEAYRAASDVINKKRSDFDTLLKTTTSTKRLLEEWSEAIRYLPTSLVAEMNSPKPPSKLKKQVVKSGITKFTI